MPEKPPQKVPSSELTRYGFLLMPEYSMMAFTAAIDQLRMANRLSGKQLYEWVLLSETEEPVYASTELTIATTPMRNAGKLDAVFVCGGINIETKNTRAITN